MFAHSKKAHTNVPVQAEAEALRWAIWVASQCNLQKVVIKGDSKICLEAIIKNGPEIPWKIDPIIKDIWSIASHIPSVKYNWVYRGCNAAAHSLAAWSLHNAYFGSFDSTFGPPNFIEIISKRPVYMYNYLSFNKVFFISYQKKKKS